MNHTPTPWEITPNTNNPPDAFFIGHGRSRVVTVVSDGRKRKGEVEANAEFIVRACNSHDALLEALREILSEFEGNYDGVFYDAVSALRIQGISRNAIAEATK